MAYWARIGLVALLIGILYASTMADMVATWWRDEQGSSYGLLIPPLAAYLAWIERRRTLAVPQSPDRRGLLPIAVACLLFLLGTLGAEYFLSRLSFVLLLAGLTWTFWGTARLRALGFPLLMLVTMIPMPLIVYNQLAAPLQLFASSTASLLAQFCGITVFQDGNIINLAHVSLGVEEACSGLNSLSALMVAGLLLGNLMCRSVSTRVALFVLTIPLSIAVNVMRITGTAVLADHHEEYAMGFYHSFSGWLVFLVGFGMLYSFAKLLSRVRA